MKVDSTALKVAVMEYYRFGRQAICVDEFNGADVIVDTGKEIIEVEVKIDRYDLIKGELKKANKHRAYKSGASWSRCHPNKFIFCVPKSLYPDAEQIVKQLNPKYGIMIFDDEALAKYGDGPLSGYIVMMKKARKLHTNYSARQQRLIAKRASCKLITLMQDIVWRSDENK